MRGARAAAGKGSAGESGVALVMVLWVIVVLTVQVGLFTFQVRDGARLVENAAAVARGQAAMQAAVETAAARLTARVPRERWAADGGERTLRIGGVDVVVSIHDENGLVNINHAEAVLIEGLLRVVGVGARDAQMLTDRIVDWRDPDQERRRQGAEDQDYRRAGVGYGAADQPFLDVADLGRVLGLSPQVVERLVEHVTVYTPDGRINPRLASETVLRALPGVTADAVKQAMELARRGGQAALEIEGVLAGARPYLNSRRGPAYRVRVRLTSDRREAVGVGEAIIVTGLDSTKPYRTLAWRFRPG
jgi:general secretion pathway protein K